MIEKPHKAYYELDQRTSTLYFRESESGQYMMRGGVCWPIPVDDGGKKDVYGYILMAGQNVETKLVTIFEQVQFVVIDHILRPDRSIEHHGISTWFNRCWSKYFASDFFWHQDNELSRKYLLEIIRSEMIRPKPQLIEVGWSDTEEAKQVIWKFVKLGKLRIEKDSQLYRELEKTKVGEKQTWPAVHALMCCLCGIERFPWRKTA